MQLDEYQSAAVFAPSRRVRALAGAGTGKTRVLTARVQYLVEKKLVLPYCILAITFSKKAEMEMKRRLRELAVGAKVQTIHALGFRILRGERQDYKVAEEWLRRRMLREALAETGHRFKLAEAARLLGLVKRGVTVPLFEDTWEAYEKIKEGKKLWDFDDMLMLSERWLSENVNLRRRWQCYEHILVDEGQDTDPLQWKLIGHMLGPRTSLFVVGDISQSIYGFRGAQPMEMLFGIDNRFGTFTQYQLPKNYRSLPEVVELANQAINGAPGALALIPHRVGPARISFELTSHGSQFVAGALAYRHAEGMQWKDMAVLYRTNAQAEPLEQRFMKEKIPFIIIGGFSFYSRTEVKDVLSYLRLSLTWDEEAADRVYNKPSRYLGKAFRSELQKQGGWNALATAGLIGLRFSRDYMARRLADFHSLVVGLQCQARAGDRPHLLVKRVYDAGYRDWLMGEEPDDADEMRGENLDSLLAASRRYQTVQEFLDYADECVRRDTASKEVAESDRVELLTIHKAKGLEWPLVCLVGCEDGLLPHYKADVEEERRLFYVAVTRAQDELLVTAGGRPSVFCREHFVSRGGAEGEDADEAAAEGDEGGAGTGERGRTSLDDSDELATGRG